MLKDVKKMLKKCYAMLHYGPGEDMPSYICPAHILFCFFNGEPIQKGRWSRLLASRCATTSRGEDISHQQHLSQGKSQPRFASQSTPSAL